MTQLEFIPFPENTLCKNVVILCRHAVTRISWCWRQCRHEELHLPMGLLPRLLGGGLGRLFFPVSGVVWEELPGALRGSGKSCSGRGEHNQLEKGGGGFNQPAPPSSCRCSTLILSRHVQSLSIYGSGKWKMFHPHCVFRYLIPLELVQTYIYQVEEAQEGIWSELIW